jgi:preprotein translocase subunit SecF
MFIIKNKFIFLIFSALLVIASCVALGVKGLNVGIDFTGGSVMEVSYDTRPALEEITAVLSEDTMQKPALIQPLGEKGVIIKYAKDLTEIERQEVVSILALDGTHPTLERYNAIGPSVGKELRLKAMRSMIIVLLGIILFISYAFRNVARDREGKRVGPSSWMYGLYTIVALIHDVIIPVGVFALFGLEVNTLFIVGLLSVLGLSVHDTIVVFDRIRERLHDDAEKKNHTPFSELVGQSVVQTMGRSINTSLTIMVTLAALYFVGPETTRGLSLVMFIGTFVGIYSSVFVASPLLVWSYKDKKTAK